MKSMNSADDLAAKRMRMIMPLLEENLDSNQIIERKKQISSQHKISYRTVSRYLKAYESHGFEGLKPSRNYTRESELPEEFPHILEHAIDLRRECPTRSIRDIIRILELEGQIIPGTLSRSTLATAYAKIRVQQTPNANLHQERNCLQTVSKTP